MFCLQFYGIQLYQYQNSIGLLLQQQAKISTIASHITSQKIIQKQNLLQNNRLIYFDYTRVFFQTQEKRHLKNLLSAHRIRQGY